MDALTRDEVMAARAAPPLFRSVPALLAAPAPDVRADCDDLPLITLWRYFRGWGDQNAMRLASGVLDALHAEGCVVLCRDPIATAPTLDAIVDVCAQVLGSPRADLLGHDRGEPLTEHRHITWTVCRELTGVSYPNLAHFFDDRDHSTVRVGIKSTRAKPERMAKVRRIVALFGEASGA